MTIDDFWNSKKNLWTKYSLERIKDEYIPIRLAYENIPIKPKVIKERLIKLERMVPSEELEKWEEQIQRGPQRGKKAVWSNESKYFQKMEETGDWSKPFVPFNKIRRYGPSPAEYYLRWHPEQRGIKKETIVKRILSFLNDSSSYKSYKSLMREIGYGTHGEMNVDVVLRRLENSGLITRVTEGIYRITLKGKEALRELEEKSYYEPFGED